MTGKGNGMDGWSWVTAAGEGQISIGIVGDTNIQDRDDPAAAFRHVIGTLRGFDALVGQWECPLTEAAPRDGHPDIGFKPRWRHSRPAMAGALRAAGFDAVSLASNVAYPPAAAAETVRHLDAAEIGHAGAGDDRTAARAPALFRAGDLTIALLSYTSVFWPIEQPATGVAPGVATIRDHTAYAPGRRTLEMPGAAPEIRTWADPRELAEMQEDVRRAAAAADIVVVSCHWCVSSQDAYVAYQQEIGRAAIEAGAHIVYGTHPHRIQAVEVYRSAPIFYSLGNFAFDWAKMRDRHRDGLLVRCLVGATGVVQTSLVPVRRGADNDVAILDPSGPDGAAIVERLRTLSAGLGTKIRVTGGEIRIEE